MKRTQPRMFEHEDLPIFTGQAPVVHQPAPRPDCTGHQPVLFPYRVYPHRMLYGFPAMDCFECGVGEAQPIPIGSEVVIVRPGQKTDRILIRASTDPKLYAWVDADLVTQ